MRERGGGGEGTHRKRSIIDRSTGVVSLSRAIAYGENSRCTTDRKVAFPRVYVQAGARVAPRQSIRDVICIPIICAESV